MNQLQKCFQKTFKARANRKLREEKKKNNEKEEPTYYVDRDRAAAVVVGSKDIKSELKVR